MNRGQENKISYRLLVEYLPQRTFSKLRIRVGFFPSTTPRRRSTNVHQEVRSKSVTSLPALCANDDVTAGLGSHPCRRGNSSVKNPECVQWRGDGTELRRRLQAAPTGSDRSPDHCSAAGRSLRQRTQTQSEEGDCRTFAIKSILKSISICWTFWKDRKERLSTRLSPDPNK